jgi:phosphatidylserine/phosphatidylglycerophosphate/cardiolipin synthase-like enzyme
MGDGALFRAFATGARALRRLGVPGPAGVPPRELDGFAYDGAYMVAARLWTLRRAEPSWSRAHAAWSEATLRPGLVDALCGTLHADDQIRLIPEGAAGFAAREALYAAARERIDIATYYVQSDETGWITARALSDCVARGVRVRLLMDRHVVAKKRVVVPGMDEMLAFLRRAGVEVRLWRDPKRPYDSNHRKLLAVDGRAAIVGGRNFADHYRGDAWRDLDLRLEGPSVGSLIELFEQVWSSTDEHGDVRPGAPVPRAELPWVDYTPAQILEDPMSRFALASMQAGVRTLDLEFAYFAAHDPLCGALEEAVRRGVRVRLLTNSAESNDLPFSTYTGYLAMRRLLAAGGGVRARRGRGRTLHCKYFVADGVRVGFGSHNLDYYSSRYCCELNLQVRDDRLGTALSAFFETGWNEATVVDLEGEVKPFLQEQRTLRLFDRVFRDFE